MSISYEDAAQAALRLEKMLDNTINDEGTIGAQDIMDVETVIYRLRMVEAKLTFGSVTLTGGQGCTLPPGEYTLVRVVK